MDATIGTLAGVILGSCLTYFLSDIQWKKQLKMQKQNIAIGFYTEIREIKNIISPITEYYESNYVTVGAPTLLDSVIHDTKVDLNKINSLYDENGLYFHFRKEIYIFETQIVTSILTFYTNLLQADEEYKSYISCLYGINATKGSDLNTAWTIQGDFVKHLLIANKEASNLITLLETYVK
ncbi:MAG: hypothetical protein NHB15_13215 [Methanosarcina barkeri]|nr:hypothetical protein [Methanosarcina sp. ERenArc_MAG2]